MHARGVGASARRAAPPAAAAAAAAAPPASAVAGRRRPAATAAITAAAAASPPRLIASLSDIVRRGGGYDGVLLDQFGVLHDGQRPYAAAIAATGALAAAGARILIVSNSSRRSGGTIGRLARMGFEASWFAGAVTSGELTHLALASRPRPADGPWRSLGDAAVHFNWGARGAIPLGELGLTAATDPAAAGFALAHGTEAVSQPGGGTRDASMAEIDALLAACAAAPGGPLPLVVANPDLARLRLWLFCAARKREGREGWGALVRSLPPPLQLPSTAARRI